MPRTARTSRANYCYHVLNRGNGRARVFHKQGNYEAFVALFERACERLPDAAGRLLRDAQLQSSG